jgi:hypothetical protein
MSARAFVNGNWSTFFARPHSRLQLVVLKVPRAARHKARQSCVKCNFRSFHVNLGQVSNTAGTSTLNAILIRPDGEIALPDEQTFLQAMYKEQCDQARQHESMRQQSTTLVLAVSAALATIGGSALSATVAPLYNAGVPRVVAFYALLGWVIWRLAQLGGSAQPETLRAQQAARCPREAVSPMACRAVPKFRLRQS